MGIQFYKVIPWKYFGFKLKIELYLETLAGIVELFENTTGKYDILSITGGSVEDFEGMVDKRDILPKEFFNKNVYFTWEVHDDGVRNSGIKSFKIVKYNKVVLTDQDIMSFSKKDFYQIKDLVKEANKNLKEAYSEYKKRMPEDYTKLVNTLWKYKNKFEDFPIPDIENILHNFKKEDLDYYAKVQIIINTGKKYLNKNKQLSEAFQKEASRIITEGTCEKQISEAVKNAVSEIFNNNQYKSIEF